MKRLLDPFEPTPDDFHRCIERKLNELQRAHTPVFRSRRWVIGLAACLVLLCSTALALHQFGVLDFLATRIEGGVDIAEENIVLPITQTCDSTLLTAAVQDAYWNGGILSVSVHVKPVNSDYAFYMETDTGTDGEHFDHIWWNGKNLPLDEWLAGRQAIMLYLPEMTINGKPACCSSWDWIAGEQGKTLLIQAETKDMTHETELSIQLQSIIVGTDTMEQATLTVTLPAMTGEEEQP